MMTNRPEFHLVDTAAFHLGAAPFSVCNTLAVEQIRRVLANAGSRVVICEQEFAPRLLAVRPGTAVQHVVCVDGRPDGTTTLAALEASRDPGPGFEARWRAVNPGDLLTLAYTSGTTGPPKGVEITHAQMLAGLTATSPILPARPTGPSPTCRWRTSPSATAATTAPCSPACRSRRWPMPRRCPAPCKTSGRRSSPACPGMGEAQGRHRSHGGLRARPGQAARHAPGDADRARARAGCAGWCGPGWDGRRLPAS